MRTAFKSSPRVWSMERNDVLLHGGETKPTVIEFLRALVDCEKASEMYLRIVCPCYRIFDSGRGENITENQKRTLQCVYIYI